MSDPKLSTGIYICDSCDNPCTVARLLVLAPNPEVLKRFKDPGKAKGIVVAFCEPCLGKPKDVRTALKDIATRYNKWVQNQQI